jgi:hypothetical protein
MTNATTRVMRSPRRRGRRGRRWIIALVVVIAVLVALDFAARAAAESVMASKIEQQGLQHKPGVSIDGFPFLTQVASRDFQQVNLTAADQTEGPVTITTINATARNIKLNSYAFSSGTIGSLSGTALISFSSLGNTLTQEVGPLGTLLNGAGLKLTAASPDEVKATLNLLVTTGSATWRVSRQSGDRLNIRLVSSSGLPSSLLGSIQDITLQIPKLPLGLTIDSVQVTTAGVVGHVTGTNVPFGN